MEELIYIGFAVLVTIFLTTLFCRWQLAHKNRISIGTLLAGIFCGAIITTTLTPVLDAGLGAFTHEYWANIITGYQRQISTVCFGWLSGSCFICIVPALGAVVYFQRATRQSVKPVIVASILLAVFATWSYFNFLGVRSTNPTAACVNTLRMIESAKEQWALENNKTTNDIPTWKVLSPYFGRPGETNNLPRCPLGGEYIIGKIGEPPKCSLGGYHVLE